MTIIPRPKKTIYFNGNFEGEKVFSVSKEIFEKFSVAWKTFDVAISEGADGKENVIFFANPDLAKEEYEISIHKDEIVVMYATDEGAFRAIATLKQIIDAGKKEEIPCMRINDKPDIDVRGIMIELSDSDVPTLEELYRVVDKLALMKYNMMQLYFDTFVFEYKSFKKYLKGKAYMTCEEIRLLDAYCRERHISLVANQNLLGHMFRWLGTDEFKNIAIPLEGRDPFTLNPLLEESFEFAKKLIDDLLPNFSSSMVHIGMDEAAGLGLSTTKDFADAFGTSTLLADWIAKISQYIKEKYHKRSMFWGDYAVKHFDTMKKLPKDVIFVDWGYEQGHKFDRNILACKEQGLDIYVAPGTQLWGTITGRTDLMIENIYDAAESARFLGAQGFLLTNWVVNDLPAINDLAYAMGGAFAWNSGYNTTIAEGGNEENCRYRNEIVKDVLKFLDEMVFKSVGERSCADLIFRMGNYYHLEQPDAVATWNGTQLYNQIYLEGCANGKLTPEPIIDIIEYMDKIKGRLPECRLECDNAAEITDELDYAIDSVIAMANAMGVKHARGTRYEGCFKAPDTDALTARRKACWCRHNKLAASTEGTINKFKYLDEYMK